MVNTITVSKNIHEYLSISETKVPALVSQAIVQHLDCRLYFDEPKQVSSTKDDIVVVSFPANSGNYYEDMETYVQSMEEVVHGVSEYVEYDKWLRESLKKLEEDSGKEVVSDDGDEDEDTFWESIMAKW